MTGNEAVFDGDFLRRLRSLFLKLRKKQRLKRRGLQAAAALGSSREFKDRRSYVSGDDFRQIDWRLYARQEKLFVRIFEQVQEFHLHLLLDVSASMIRPWPEKRRQSLRLALAVAYLGLSAGHCVSLYTFNREIRRELPPLKGAGHIHSLLGHLPRLAYGGVTDIRRCLRGFHPGGERRGMVFLLSDLFDPRPEQLADALRLVSRWPAETHVVCLNHPAEREPGLEGEIRLLDPESGEHRSITLTRKDMENYRERFDRHQDALRQACLCRQADFLAWDVSRPFEDLLGTLLERGSALAAS